MTYKTIVLWINVALDKLTKSDFARHIRDSLDEKYYLRYRWCTTARQ